LPSIRHLVPVRQLGRVDLLDKALIDIELLPAGVEVEDVRLTAALHQGQDIGIAGAQLELHIGVRIRFGEVHPEVRLFIAAPFEDEEFVRLGFS
jgi:hypothetical protein